ncbi:DsbA family protein [uncultured Chitinophaga sp.]|jgi:Predicted dithiol-disulfide isomerase involved in polyketide biosynthesis|uniref:DsbA family protein n=1 Tax=uncultured Chitinophaga sp. TaxID=339340 RepID=UPI002628AC20|nr:DsbA family protein [uncultured Chitinophaga sp.]
MQEAPVKQKVNKKQASQVQSGQLEVVYYTDPLCCWSWAFEPAWQQLLQEYQGRISWRYCMGGLLAEWRAYHDTMNAVSKPVQMGPLWMQASQVSGQPMNDRIWFLDPPASSYPACLAVKCAGMQSEQAAHLYLYALRAAIMKDGKNIAKKAVLLETAAALTAEHPGCLDLKQFEADLGSEQAMQLLKQDLQEVSYRNINRLPTLVVKQGERRVVITGYRPFEVLKDVISQM